MGLIYELLLVFVKNCMSVARLRQEIERIENSWLHSMTDFIKVSQLKKSAVECGRRCPYFCTTLHLLTGHMLDKRLYLMRI